MVKPYDGPILWTYEYSGEALASIGMGVYDSKDAESATPTATYADKRRATLARKFSFSQMQKLRSVRLVDDAQVGDDAQALEKIQKIKDSYQGLIRNEAIRDKFLSVVNQVLVGDAARTREFEKHSITVNATDSQIIVSVKEDHSAIDIRIVGVVTELSVPKFDKNGFPIAQPPMYGEPLFTYDTTFQIKMGGADNKEAVVSVLKHRIAVHDARVDEACPWLSENLTFSFAERFGFAMRRIGQFITKHPIVSSIVGLLLVGGMVATGFLAPLIVLIPVAAVIGTCCLVGTGTAISDYRFHNKLRGGMTQKSGEDLLIGDENLETKMEGVPLTAINDRYFSVSIRKSEAPIPPFSTSDEVADRSLRVETHSDNEESKAGEGKSKKEIRSSLKVDTQSDEGESSEEDSSPPPTSTPPRSPSR